MHVIESGWIEVTANFYNTKARFGEMDIEVQKWKTTLNLCINELIELFPCSHRAEVCSSGVVIETYGVVAV